MDRLGTTRREPGSRYSGQCNYTSGDALQQFKSAMLDSIGTSPDEIIPDGSLHRFKIDGKLNGAYVLHLDGRAAGYFEDFKQGIKVRWKLEGDFRPLTQAERQAFVIERQRQADERQTEEAAKHKAAESKTVYILNNAKPAPANHPYLIHKGVNPHNVRWYRGSLVIPLYDENGVLVSLQFISEDGTKRFLSGGKTQGSCCFMGELQPGGTILICEGWATGASLYEATGLFTVIAFSAGNLKAVAELTRKHYPENAIIICGDNDFSGTGQRAARAAALAIGGKYILPATVGHDWNDAINAEVCHG